MSLIFVQHFTKPSLFTMAFNPKCVKFLQNPEHVEFAHRRSESITSIYTEAKKPILSRKSKDEF